MAQAEFDELVETFEFLDDWEDRYRHIIEMGKAMPSLDDALKVPATKVEGCASQVWLIVDSTSETFSFRGDSDAIIVRGLIAVLGAVVNDEPLEVVANMDVKSKLAQLGLDDHLSAQRSNGLNAMVQRLQSAAVR